MENTVKLFGLFGLVAIGMVWIMAHVNFWFNRSDGHTWGFACFVMTAYLDLVK